jgi:hypothetical protein
LRCRSQSRRGVYRFLVRRLSRRIDAKVNEPPCQALRRFDSTAKHKRYSSRPPLTYCPALHITSRPSYKIHWSRSLLCSRVDLGGSGTYRHSWKDWSNAKFARLRVCPIIRLSRNVNSTWFQWRALGDTAFSLWNHSKTCEFVEVQLLVAWCTRSVLGCWKHVLTRQRVRRVCGGRWRRYEKLNGGSVRSVVPLYLPRYREPTMPQVLSSNEQVSV